MLQETWFRKCDWVDKPKQNGVLASVISLDLTPLSDQQLVLQWLEHPDVKVVFLAPPCGTASAAQKIELPGNWAPRPLRILEEPDLNSRFSRC